MAAAYLVVFVVLLAYVVIIAAKLQRLEREVAELVERARGVATNPPVSDGGPVEGVWRSRDVPPARKAGADG